jgi:nucleoside phosphorylase
MGLPPNYTYEVGWICALYKEFAAAQAMLDEEHGIIQHKDAQDVNTYAAGRVHQHNIVIACLPAGVDGTNAAATVAQNMLRTFPQIRIGLLVGIGGGIPHLEKDVDIRLGDVVVSQPDGEHGGVVHYDKGKMVESDQDLGLGFVRKGSLNKPPALLLNALSMLRAKHEIEDSQMARYLGKMMERKPKMKKTGYGFPGSDQDHLFRLGPHRLNESRADTDRDFIATSNLEEVVRPPRDTNDPEVHYGIIASGNSVIKHAGVRDTLRDKLGAMCVEMEAAGLMDGFPCLVIRGICDYADSFKNDAWHRYAATTAAAYAKEFLLYISPQQLHESQPAREVVGKSYFIWCMTCTARLVRTALAIEK